MTSPAELSLARAEIERLHVFFEEWFQGVCSRDALQSQLLDVLAGDFRYVFPGGVELSAGGLEHGLVGAYASNPGFRILVRDVRVHHVTEDSIFASYCEWQKNAVNSTPQNNGRLSSVLFRHEGERLLWAHLQETWLPLGAMEAFDFDFG